MSKADVIEEECRGEEEVAKEVALLAKLPDHMRTKPAFWENGDVVHPKWCEECAAKRRHCFRRPGRACRMCRRGRNKCMLVPVRAKNAVKGTDIEAPMPGKI